MADVIISIAGQKEITRRLREIPNSLFEHAALGMRKTLAGLHKTMVQRSGGGLGELKGRTGELKRSWRFNVTGSGIKTLTGTVESVGVSYASIHEYGGIIRAKGGKSLTIPTDWNKTKAGVTRMTARMVFDKGGFVRNGIIFLKQKGKKVPTPMFILAKQVKIPARLGFREQAEIYGKKLLGELNDILEK